MVSMKLRFWNHIAIEKEFAIGTRRLHRYQTLSETFDAAIPSSVVYKKENCNVVTYLLRGDAEKISG